MDVPRRTLDHERGCCGRAGEAMTEQQAEMLALLPFPVGLRDCRLVTLGPWTVTLSGDQI